jgi:hypothetical protein
MPPAELMRVQYFRWRKMHLQILFAFDGIYPPVRVIWLGRKTHMGK